MVGLGWPLKTTVRPWCKVAPGEPGLYPVLAHGIPIAAWLSGHRAASLVIGAGMTDRFGPRPARIVHAAGQNRHRTAGGYPNWSIRHRLGRAQALHRFLMRTGHVQQRSETVRYSGRQAVMGNSKGGYGVGGDNLSTTPD